MREVLETKYEKLKRFNSIILVTIIFVWIAALIICGYAVEANYGEKTANIVVSCFAGLFFVFLAIYMPIYLVKMRKERIAYAEFYKNLSKESFYIKFDNVIFKDKAGRKIKVFQVDRKGFREDFADAIWYGKEDSVDVIWNDYDIKVHENFIGGLVIMSLRFVLKKNPELFFNISPTWKNFYIIKNYCGQAIENVDMLEQYVEQTSYINKL